MHWNFEAWINRVQVSEDSDEMRLFLPVMRSLEGLEAYRTEWMIYASSERLAGSIDFVARKTDGSLILYDWKRSKDLRNKYTSPWRQMNGPLRHLDDCAGT